MKTLSQVIHTTTLFTILILSSHITTANDITTAKVEGNKIILTIPYLEYQGIDGTEAYSATLESTTNLNNYLVREGTLLSVPVQCHAPRPEICTSIFTPVCANLSSSPGTQATYSNACSACSDSNVSSYIRGSCE